MFSPIILIACLLAPTVPSDPNPQNLHLTVPGVKTLNSSSTGIEVFVTSSSIPTVKLFLASSFLRLSNIALMCVGVTSFEANP